MVIQNFPFSHRFLVVQASIGLSLITGVPVWFPSVGPPCAYGKFKHPLSCHMLEVVTIPTELPSLTLFCQQSSGHQLSPLYFAGVSQTPVPAAL